MDIKSGFWLCFLLLQCFYPCNGFTPVSGLMAGLAGLGSLIYSGFNGMRCTIMICCDKKHVQINAPGLENDLQNKLHGQHLVTRAVVGHIKGHLQTQNPSKALALSFHGVTGVGKNFVSKIIADNLYKEGLHSLFVHLISATKEFPHEGMVPFYKEQLKQWIEGNVTKCDRSMFIFDEVDKLPSLLLDVIKPYLDYYEHLGGVSYRKAIFIFLSNEGGSDISQAVFDHWKSGKRREDLKLKDVEDKIVLATVNSDTQGGLWHSQLISQHLITAYIPFLPLEREHVRGCIKDDLRKKFRTYNGRDIKEGMEALVEEVMEELKFVPEVEQVFSATGCKRVSEKVDYVMTDKSVQRKEEL